MKQRSDETAAFCRYENIQRECEQLIRREGIRWSVLSYVRGGMFLLSIALVVCGFVQVASLFQPWLWLAGICFLAFLIVAAVHTNIEVALELARLRLRSAKRSIARRKRQWNRLPPSRQEPPTEFASVSYDLDLFGNDSLYQWIGTVYTPVGIRTMRDWVANGAGVVEVVERQKAVADLRNRDTWRDQFALDCEYLGASPSGPAAFVAWAESEPWLLKRSWLLWLCRVLAVATLLSLLLTLFGLVPKEIGLPALMGLVIVSFFVSVFFAGRIHDIFNSIASRKKEIDVYQKLFGEIHSLDVESELLIRLKDDMVNSRTGAIHRLHSLGGLVWMASMRRNGILFPLYLLLQFLFCWDVHVLHLLERWQSRNGMVVRQWFEALGEWECLVALAKIASDQPDWNFPAMVEPVEKELNIVASELGHPLLPDDDRVCNDTEVGPPGTILLVTGSNMSGKSTLLRSIGVNLVLAQMGSVVAAKEMTCSPMRLETSMRIHDDLAGGVSFFMAELKRLKQIVDIAALHDQQKPMLFLLDEILQGTNSAERHIAVTQVVQSLINSGAIGAISSHDLELADAGSLGQHCRTVHFREHFFERDGKEIMEFDYLMRQGVSPTTNALKLLKLVGLKFEE